MKISVYARSLIYAVLLNLAYLILLKIFFPEVNLFKFPQFFFFEGISISLCYMVFVLLYKKSFQSIAKNALKKNEKRSIIQKTKETNQKDIQLALLKDREKYRREFLGNVSHELKTPLFTIQGYILTLIDGAVKNKTIRNNYLSRINKSVDRLIYIVRDLDVLAEIESGNFSLDFKPFNIETLTKDVFEFLEIKAKENQVRLTLNSELKNNAMVMGDRDRIEQVMTNLIANAIFYSKRENAEVKVVLSQAGNQIQIEVEDNGQGIAPEHLPRIFERFYRVDSARSREKGGSGLGLAIVKNILEAHKSEISLTSEIDKGSNFKFQLETDTVNP